MLDIHINPMLHFYEQFTDINKDEKKKCKAPRQKQTYYIPQNTSGGILPVVDATGEV